MTSLADRATGLDEVPTWLYVPADRIATFLPKAVAGADGVVLDLEDAVHPSARVTAREAIVAHLTSLQPVPVLVRVNHVESADFLADVAAIGPLLARRLVQGIRLPKVASAADVAVAWAALSLYEDRPHLVPLLESALGVRNARHIAAATGVHSIGLGESDLRADLGLPRGGLADDGLLLSRMEVVLASRAAGLPAPVGSVFANVTDTEALAASCAELRRLGFYGRSVIHPRQVPVVRAAFAPTTEEVAWAGSVLERAGALDTSGGATATLDDGSFVDPAIVRQAQQIARRVAS